MQESITNGTFSMCAVDGVVPPQEKYCKILFYIIDYEQINT